MRTLIALIAFAALDFSPILRADDPQPPKTFDLKAIDDYVAAEVKTKSIVGLSLAIVRDGKIVHAKGYGKSSLAEHRDVDLETMFAIGSVTKQFTCACILLLAEDRKLAVSDLVAKYYPNLTRAKDITLYDLMSHVSGYPDYYPLDFVDRRMKKAIEPDKLIEEYAGGKLDFKPQTRWSYSNTGYIILGRIVEKVSGEPFDKFLTERILKPLGMEHSLFEPANGVKGVAQGYTSFALGDPEPAVREASGWIHAAGGLYSTASDLARWDLALMSGKVLKAASFDLMTEPRKLLDGRVKNYGCGLMITQREGETVFRHGGAVSGFLTQNAFVPRTNSAVIVLANSENAEVSQIHTAILNLVLRDRAGGPDIPKVKGPPAKEAALDFLHQMQEGQIKRGNLGEEFNIYLSQERVDGARDRLKAFGEPDKVEIEDTAERGGMEVSVVRFVFKTTSVKALLYRSPDGKIQQLLLLKG
jgi:D-alanyl-D-alanine carboxypeptidase